MSKPNKNRERREMVEKMRREAKAAERRRTMIVVVLCVVVAVAIIGVAGVAYIKDKNKKDELKNADISKVGDTAAAASCTEVEEADATGTQQHVTTPVIYDVEPPSYGPHNPTPAGAGTYFYTPTTGRRSRCWCTTSSTAGRSSGTTTRWLTTPTQLNLIKATAEKYAAHGGDPAYNVIFAPWTADDGQSGGVIPEGKHFAFTHWSIHQQTYDPSVFEGVDADDPITSYGESQYCSTFSGEALVDFTNEYPYDDAPEGSIWHRPS